MQYIKQYGEVMPSTRKKRRNDAVNRDNSATIQKLYLRSAKAALIVFPINGFDQPGNSLRAVNQ